MVRPRSWILALCLTAVLSGLNLATPAQASEARETHLVKAIKRARQSVVNIHSEKTSRADLFESGRKVNGMGSGLIIDERGFIVTNQHVIADVDSLRVTLNDGSTYHASIISYDRKHDLAVIKIEATKPLTVIPMGTSSDLMVGETVVAVGNPYGYEHTATAGIISALHRDVEVNEQQGYLNLIQTDASINPGNSGGPLINADGEAIGINVAIRAGAQRIGFAIPIDDARKFIAKLISTRQLDETWHGLLTRDEKTTDIRRCLVEGLEPTSPASSAGFQSGDVILEVGSIKVTDGVDLERGLLGHAAGDSVDFIVQRANENVTLKLQLARATTGVTRASQVVRAQPEDKAWNMLGLRLSKTQTQLSTTSQFRGGMKVTEVRGSSPASKVGIKSGDVLVGLHDWETVKPEDVSFVVNHPQLADFSPLKFYIIRNGKTLSGKLAVTK